MYLLAAVLAMLATYYYTYIPIYIYIETCYFFIVVPSLSVVSAYLCYSMCEGGLTF